MALEAWQNDLENLQEVSGSLFLPIVGEAADRLEIEDVLLSEDDKAGLALMMSMAGLGKTDPVFWEKYLGAHQRRTHPQFLSGQLVKAQSGSIDVKAPRLLMLTSVATHGLGPGGDFIPQKRRAMAHGIGEPTREIGVKDRKVYKWEPLPGGESEARAKHEAREGFHSKHVLTTQASLLVVAREIYRVTAEVLMRLGQTDLALAISSVSHHIQGLAKLWQLIQKAGVKNLSPALRDEIIITRRLLEETDPFASIGGVYA